MSTTVKNYEPGMRIIYDQQRKTANVTFRGRLKALDGTFLSEASARAAGEAYCHSLGWNPNPIPAAAPVAKSLLAHRKTARPFL